MPDAFVDRARSALDPAITIFDVDPSDVADLPHVTTAVNVTTPGTIRVTMADGTVGDLTVQPGQMIPLRVRRVWVTGTTATGIKGLS